MEHSVAMHITGSTALPPLSTLLEALDSEDLATYFGAREALLEQRQVVLPVLVDLMLSRTDRLGWRATLLVASMKDTTTVPAIIQALQSPNALIRQIAAQMLGDSNDATVIAALLALLHDDNCGVQTWVVESLGNLRANTAVQPLCDLLSTTDSTELQQSLIRALGRMGDPEAAMCLLPFLNSPNHHVRSRAHEIHRQLSSLTPGSASCT